jgi:hypothetical protein
VPYTPSDSDRQKPGGQEAQAMPHVIHVSPAHAIVGIHALVHHFFVTRRLSLRLPLCERHFRTAVVHHPRLRVLALFLTVLGAVVMVPTAVALFFVGPRGMDNAQVTYIWGFGGIASGCIIAALLIRARLHDGFLFVIRATEQEIELGGMTPDFVDRIGAIESQQKKMP